MHFIQIDALAWAADFKEFIAFGVFVVLNSVVRWLQSRGWRGGMKTGVDSIGSGVDTITEKITGLEATLATVKHEFEINGGGTVKAAVVAMRESMDQLRDIQTAHATIQMNTCDFPVFKCDKVGNWTFANEVLVELFGGSYQGYMKKKWLELIPNVQDRLRIIKTFNECALNDIPFRESVPFQNQDDERIFLCDIRANAFRGRMISGTNEAPVLFYFGRLEVIKEVTPDPEGD